MRSFLRQSDQTRAFDPATINLMVAAFEDAWKSVQSSGAEYTSDVYSKAARETLAQYILTAAINGERDQHGLAQGAVLQLSHENLKHLR